MKKMLSLIAALMIIATQTPYAYIQPESVMAEQTEQIESVSINISELTEITNGMITVTYDNTKLLLKSSKAGDTLSSAMCAVSNKEGKVTIGFVSSKVISVEGSLLDIEFERISGTEDISELCSFEINEFISLDKDGKEYNASTDSVKLVSDTVKESAVVSVVGKISEETSLPQVMLNISENTNATNGVFTVKYDPEIIKFENGSVCKAFEGVMAEINEVSPGTIKIAFINNTAISAGGDMIQLDFSAVSEGNTALEVEVNELCNISDDSAKDIICKTVSDSLTIDKVEKSKITLTDATAEVTGKADIFVSLPENTGVTNGSMMLEYDTKLVKFDSSEICEAFEGVMAEVNEVEPGKIMIAFIKSDGISIGGNALKLSFTAIAEGETSLALSVKEFSKISVTGDISDIPVETANGKITVTVSEEVEYDVDGNGVVSAIDLVYVQKCILDSLNVTPDIFRRADVNKNGEVNIFDLIRLKQIMLEQG